MLFFYKNTMNIRTFHGRFKNGIEKNYQFESLLTQIINSMNVTLHHATVKAVDQEILKKMLVRFDSVQCMHALFL